MCHFAAFSIGQQDPCVVQQQSGGAVQLHLGFFICGHGRHQCRFGLRQGASVLQHQRGGGSSQRIFLLFRIERLAAQINRCLGGGDAGAVLLNRKLGVAYFDTNLVLQLLQSHLRLAVFQF